VVWDIASGKPLTKWSAHQDWVSALALAESNKLLASAGYDHAARLWHLDNGQKLRDLPLAVQTDKPAAPTLAAPSIIHTLAFSPDGKWLAGGGLDGNIRLWEPNTGNLVRILTGHTSRVTGLAFHPAGQILASCSSDRTIRLWNLSNGQVVRVLEGHQSWVQAAVFVDQGTRLVSASTDGTLRVWDLQAPPK
jgi:WD40 repeat protein